MDALIIAAGYGSRLRTIADPKPLATVSGRPLIEIAILQAAAAGVSRVVVVTGYKADVIEAALPAIAQGAGIPVEAVQVDNWSRPNGYSVMAGAALIDGPFLLLMADHIFERGILQSLVFAPVPNNGVTLAIDRRVDDPQIDPDDATWVRTGEVGRIKSIGKSLQHYDAVDCGAFLATSGLSDAIAAAVAAGMPGSLSDGMQRLADAGRAATFDIGDGWWLDVDDPRAHAVAEKLVPGKLWEIFGRK